MSKILVIDDELQIRRLLSDELSSLYDVVTVPSADQALHLLKTDVFDLVILDLRLDGELAILMIPKIHEICPKLPVIVYSGMITPDIEKTARAAGAEEVMSKDTGIVPLMTQIKKFLSSHNRTIRRKDRPILIVDDESNLRKVLKDFLANKGYRTLEAESGEKALEVVRSEDIGVALLDIQMSGMDGLETLKKLLELSPGLGVVMVTGTHSDEKVKKALELGAYGYVLKPFDFLYLELVVLSRLMIAEKDS